MVRTISNAFESRPHPAGLDPHRRARRRQDHDRAHPRARAQLRAARRLGDRPDHQHAGARRALPGDHGEPASRRDRDGRGLPQRRRRRAPDQRRHPLRAGAARATRSTSSTKCTCCRAQAFNALLKTLEEPPPHAKFIFATTEIRKVPVTVLSRCQRFDLRRVDAGLLVKHLAGHRREGGDRGRAGGAGADRARGRRLGARFALAARPGDRARRRPGARRGRAADARACRPHPHHRPVRGAHARRRGGGARRSCARNTTPAPIRRWCSPISPSSRISSPA